MNRGVAVKLAGVSYRYHDGTAGLDGVDLVIGAGERIGLIGPNGAGKSTLLLHLNGILRGEGEITVGDLPVTQANLPAVRRCVGLVFQNPDDQLFCSTLRDDVAFGPANLGLPAKEVDRRVAGALDAVGLSEERERNAWHLSFGQKKKAALATVLSLTPGVIALDEPVSNLDPRGRREMVDLLRSVPGTMIIATHQLDVVRALSSRVVILHEGKVAADGPPGAILDDRSLLDRCGLR